MAAYQKIVVEVSPETHEKFTAIVRKMNTSKTALLKGYIESKILEDESAPDGRFFATRRKTARVKKA